MKNANEIQHRSVTDKPRIERCTYTFVDASLEIEVLELAVSIGVLLLDGVQTSGASVQSLLEANAAGLALHTELSSNTALFHFVIVRELSTPATDMGQETSIKKSAKLTAAKFRQRCAKLRKWQVHWKFQILLKFGPSLIVDLPVPTQQFPGMEIIPASAIMMGCWMAVAGLTRGVLFISNDRVRLGN